MPFANTTLRCSFNKNQFKNPNSNVIIGIWIFFLHNQKKNYTIAQILQDLKLPVYVY